MKRKLCATALFISLLGTCFSAIEDLESAALSMVPRGIMAFKTTREFMVRTKGGTRIKVEFERNGNFQEASGLNLNKGDEFEPGLGLLSLSSAAQGLSSQGFKLAGDWNLEKDETHGWIYEMAVLEQDEIQFKLIKASSGEVINLNATDPLAVLKSDRGRALRNQAVSIK